MEESKQSSAPVKLIIRLLLTILLVFLMSTFLDRIFFLDGGLPAYIIIGSLLTLMNVIVRPILHVLTLPLKLFATILALIIVNGLFLLLTEKISQAFDPALVVLHIDGGIGGWILVAIILGMANWVMKVILK
jgi:putative membrane protein